MGYFFSQLTRSIGVFFRTLRAFFVRKMMGITTAIRRLTNFSRHATKVAASSIQGVVGAAQKPTSPSDYVETGHLYISKALIIRVLLIIIALVLIVYFVVWPFVLSRFLTARFFVEDKRVANWSGRVIVFADKKKTIPMYSGRLEKGTLQGEGKLYDSEGVLSYEGQIKDGERNGSGKEYDDGILVYEGQFVSGLYSGNGKSYDGGQLAYEGQFSNGLFSGYGKRYDGNWIVYDGQYEEGKRSGSGTAYSDGKRLYDGQFMDDLYEGRGKLYQDGKLRYDGSFHAGVPEGTGTAYYPGGKVSYQGQYLAGREDGTGTAYAENGMKTYSGGFAEGVYSGEGTLFFTDGSQISATFEDGEPTGSVEWKKNGILYYRGEWDEGAPSGFGTLYSKSGKVLYEGPFLGGTIDGRSLLDYSTDELRTALADSSVKNENDGSAFRIIADELGLTVLCTFQTESEDSRIYQIYLSAPEKNDWIAILPGMDHTLAVQWPEGEEPDPLRIQYIGQLGVSVPAGSYPAENNVKDARRTTALYEDEQREHSVLVTWERQDVKPSPMTPGGGNSSKVDKLLDALDKMIGSEGTAASKGASFGGGSTDAAFAELDDADAAVSATDAMIDYWEETERQHSLEEVVERNETLLADARSALAKGIGSEEAVKALEQTQEELKTQIEACRTAIKRAELQAGSAGVENIGAYALEELLVSFDPADHKVDELVPIAVAYAQAVGGDVDASAVEAQVKLGLLNLADAYSAMKLALSRYQNLSASAKDAAGAFSMGLGAKDAWYGAMNSETLARIDLCKAMAEFSKQANHFNQLTGGWVSKTFDWHKGVFDVLFRAAIPEENDGEEGGDGADVVPEDRKDEPLEPVLPVQEDDPDAPKKTTD